MEIRVALSDPWDPHQLRGELARRAFVILTDPPAGVRPEDAARDPWDYVGRLLGVRPRMVERQPIRAVAGGRSFASTSQFTPLHTDSQLYDGAPPDLQVMACIQADAQGGQSTLLDTWALLAQIEREDMPLFVHLFTRRLRHGFVFGDLVGPIAALRGGALAFTHSPRPPEHEIARRLAWWLERTPPHAVAVRTGETLLVDNRRALHGRHAFQDTRREFVRLLVWLPEPLARHPRYESLARPERDHAASQATAAPPEARRRAGLPGAPLPEAEDRLHLVMAMLRGAPPGVLAARFQVPEPALYAWRDAALRAALEALNALRPEIDEEALRELLRGGR